MKSTKLFRKICLKIFFIKWTKFNLTNKNNLKSIYLLKLDLTYKPLLNYNKRN